MTAAGSLLPCAARRGSAAAAGLLLASHEAGSQGNALLTYTWASNALVRRAVGGSCCCCFVLAKHVAAMCSTDRLLSCLSSPQPAPHAHPQEVTFGVPAPAGPAADAIAAAQLHLPAPPAASSPRKHQLGTSAEVPESPAAAAVQADAGAAVDVQLAALAEPLPQAPAVEEAAAEAAAPGTAPGRRIGGRLAAAAADEDGRVRLRVLLDGSALEVFTSSGEVRGATSGLCRFARLLLLLLCEGRPPYTSDCPGVGLLSPAAAKPLPAWQVLSTRVYRGALPAGSTAAGLSIVALGGTAVLESGAAWEMDGCWAAEEGEESAG